MNVSISLQGFHYVHFTDNGLLDYRMGLRQAHDAAREIAQASASIREDTA